MNRRIATQARITVTTVAALYLLATDALWERVGGRDDDRGELVSTLIMVAGFVALAIVVVGGIGIVVNKYMAKIQ